MTREDLLKSKEYWTSQIQNDLFEVMEGYMKEKNLKRKQLADEFKVSKGYITQILNGDFDHKVSKLIDISLACGKVPVLHFVDIEKYIEDDKNDRLHVYDKDFKPVKYFTIKVNDARKIATDFQSQRIEGNVNHYAFPADFKASISSVFS